jgi:hypothetical protein
MRSRDGSTLISDHLLLAWKEESRLMIGETLKAPREPEEPEPFLPSSLPSKGRPFPEWNQKNLKAPSDESKRYPIMTQEFTSVVSIYIMMT